MPKKKKKIEVRKYFWAQRNQDTGMVGENNKEWDKVIRYFF